MTGMLPGHEVAPQGTPRVRNGGEASQQRFVAWITEHEIAGTSVGEPFKFFLDRAAALILNE